MSFGENRATLIMSRQMRTGTPQGGSVGESVFASVVTTIVKAWVTGAPKLFMALTVPE